MPFKLLASEIVYQGRAFTIRRDHMELPDGRTVQFDIVAHTGSVVLLPLDANGNLLFVRQYRHPAKLELLELPAGTLDEDEAPEACARREIREETGMAAGKLKEIGQFYLAPGYSTEFMHVYLASELRPDPLEPDADEFLQVEAIPLAQALEMAQRGEVPDAKSLAALYLARTYLEKHL
jgi:ADP-ribose pyrophosphatase